MWEQGGRRPEPEGLVLDVTVYMFPRRLAEGGLIHADPTYVGVMTQPAEARRKNIEPAKGTAPTFVGELSSGPWAHAPGAHGNGK